MVAQRLLETVGLAVVATAFLALAFDGPWFVAIGPITAVGLVMISAASSVCLMVRALALRIRGRPDPAVPLTRELAARPPRFRYVIAAILSLAAIVVMSSVSEPGATKLKWGFATVFAVAAMGVATWTYAVRVDASRRRIARLVGPRITRWMAPFWVSVRDVPPGGRLELDETYRSTGKHSGYHVHTIRLSAPSMLVHEHRNADVARLCAERLAKQLALDLVDRTCEIDPSRSRAVDDLDLPLATQLLRRGVTTGRRKPPATSKLTFESDEVPWVVHIPVRGLRMGDVVACVVIMPLIVAGCLIPAGAIASLAGHGTPRMTWPLAVGMCVVVSWFVLWRMVLRTRRETQQVRLSPAGISVVRRALGSRFGGELAADQIEELVVTFNRERGGEELCVVARGDGVSLAFGHGLERDDACWLRDTAIVALAPPQIYR